jgi:hypothetical protein
MTPLSDQELNFIAEHAQADTQKLLLGAKAKNESRVSFLIDQIEARKKLSQKIPSWVANKNIIFPSRVSTEQSSSEYTAQFKSSLVSGFRLADLSGGMGVDFFAMAKNFSQAYYLEQQEVLCQIAALNKETLAINHAHIIHGNGIEWFTVCILRPCP